MSESNQEKNQAEMVDKQQEREALVKQIDEIKSQKFDEEDRVSQLLTQRDEARKELEKVRKRIGAVNEDDKSKRFRIDELNKTIESTKEREASLQDEIEKLKKQNSEKEKVFDEKEKELNILKQELASFKEQKEKAKTEAQKQESTKRSELIKQAALISKKHNDPDILKLVQNAKDNATRELILNKLKPKKVDTVKVTELSTLYNPDKRNVNILNTSVSQLSQLRKSDPDLYEDIIGKAGSLKW